MVHQKPEFIKFQENGSNKPLSEDQKIMIAIRSLNLRYKILMGVMYAMIFLFSFVIYRIYEIFQIIG